MHVYYNRHWTDILMISRILTPPGSINTNIDGELFRAVDAAGRKRRQLQPPVNLDHSYDSFNYTAEQIALCGDDSACLFDFAVTGDKDAAVTTLEKGNNFTDVVVASIPLFAVI